MNDYVPKKYAIYLLGGSGTRYGERIPKQFTYLGDDILMNYALKTLNASPEIDGIYLVADPSYRELVLDLAKQANCLKVKDAFPSGSSREESVYNAISALKGAVNKKDLVLICDGDRPNLDPKLILDVLKEAKIHGAAVTAIPVNDSILESHDGEFVKKYRRRSEVFAVQTPQGFVYQTILLSLEGAKRDKMLSGFTDDASVVRAYRRGIKIKIVKGHRDNLKITTKEDAEAFLRGLHK